VIDSALLDEVTALVEWPVTITGTFDNEFLGLPEEVLIATMQGQGPRPSSIVDLDEEDGSQQG